MTDPALRDSYDEIILDGMPLRLRGVMPDSNLATFQRKMVIGDYTQDSNPLLSSWVTSDLSGGHGIEDMNESSDSTRYRIGTFHTRYAGQISKQYAITAVPAGSNTDIWPTDAMGVYAQIRFLGDLYVAGTWQGIVALSTNVISIAAKDTLLGTLTTAPVSRSVVHRGTGAYDLLIVPMGASGYATISANAYTLTNIAPGANSPALMAAVVWDEKVIGVDTAGQLWWTTDASGVWTSYGTTARVPNGSRTNVLVAYFDRSGQPCVFVVTDSDVWQFDPSGPQIFSVDVFFPRHPYYGLAASKWSGDLYFSVGIGVHRYTGGALSAIGLDRDAGLPAEYTGYINGGNLIGGYNALYAGLQRGGYPSSVYPSSIVPSIHEWTGAGWHMAWQGKGFENLMDNSLFISQHNGNHRLYWSILSAGAYYKLYYMDLPSVFANPRERARAGATFTPSTTMPYFMETPIFDAGMEGYKKVASSLDVRVTVMDPAAVLTVKYRIDGPTDWTTLGTITTTGVTSIPFGVLANGIHPGQIFDRIQFRYELTDATTAAFIMEAAVLSFIKTVPPSNSWTPTVDMTYTHAGNSPEVMRQHIENILKNRVFVPLVFRGNTYRVIVSSSSGSSQTGFDEGNLRQVSLLEVPETLGAVA